MHQPPLFREDRTDILHDLMRAHPFATLVAYAGGILSADHIPLVLHEDAAEQGILRGHIAAGNPLRDAAKGGLDVLAIFQGPQAYITPSWYATKAEHGKVVPTWNYAVVQAHGRLVLRDDPAWLMAHLNSLTNQHEGARTAPWAVADAPADFIARQLKGLIGFEITLTSLDGKWKVSQNRTEADRAGVVAGLRDAGAGRNEAMADLVARAKT